MSRNIPPPPLPKINWIRGPHHGSDQNGKKAAKTSKKSKCFNFDKNFTGLFPTTYLIMKQKEFFFIKLFLQTEK